MQPFLELLTDDELYEIHVASLEVLEKAGIVIQNDEVLKKLEESGASIDYARQLARIPENLIKEALRKCPSEVTLYSRNPKYNARLWKKRTYISTTGGSPNVIDLETGQHRPALKEDIANLTRLADGLENINFNEGLADPQDVPHAVRDIFSAAIILANTEKHCRYCVVSSRGARAFIKMAAAIMGEEEQLRRRPIISGAGYPAPPLRYDKLGISILLEFIKHGLPTYVGSEPISGGSAPITLAGTLVQNNADALAGILIVQLINPGTPVIYGGNCNSMDMRTAAVAEASPENALMGAAIAQLARYYNLPSWVYSDITNSKIPDQQAGYEKTAGALMTLLAGVNILGGAGNTSSAVATSYEQLVIDDELLGMLRRIARGIDVNDETLAVDIICKVGSGGHYLAEKHTLKHLTNEHWMPKVCERRSLDGWRKAGAKDIIQKARDRAKEILRTHYPEPLPKDVQDEINRIISEEKALLKEEKK